MWKKGNYELRLRSVRSPLIAQNCCYSICSLDLLKTLKLLWIQSKKKNFLALNLFSHVYSPLLQPLPSSLQLFPILLLFSSRFLCIFSPLFLYFLSSSSLPKPSTDSYNIYDCLEHTLAAENWRAYIAIFIPILTAFLLSDFLFHRTELHQLSGGSDLLQTRSGENVVWSQRQIFLLPM